MTFSPSLLLRSLIAALALLVSSAHADVPACAELTAFLEAPWSPDEVKAGDCQNELAVASRLDALLTPACAQAAARGEAPHLSAILRERHHELFQSERRYRRCERMLLELNTDAMCRLRPPDALDEMTSWLRAFTANERCFDGIGEMAIAGDARAVTILNTYIDEGTASGVYDLLLRSGAAHRAPGWRVYHARALRHANQTHATWRDRLWVAYCGNGASPAMDDLDRACAEVGPDQEPVWNRTRDHYHNHVLPHILTATLSLATLVVAGGMMAASFAMKDTTNNGAIVFGVWEGVTAGSLLGLGVGASLAPDYPVETYVAAAVGVVLGSLVGGVTEGMGWGPGGSTRLDSGIAGAGITLVGGLLTILLEVYVFHFHS